MQLRDYQQEAIEMVRDEIRRGKKRILVVLGTGAGKTHVLSAIASGAVRKGNIVLALMHRRQLVTQMVERFAENGIDCDTIMAGLESRLKSSVQVSTIQTYSRRLMLDSIDRNRFFVDATIVMIDEAHHALSKSYQSVLKHYEDKIVIGVTATPVLSTGIGMGEYFDAIVSPVTVQKLVDQKHLVPGVYYGPSAPDLSKVKVVMGDYHKGELEKAMNQPKLVGDVVENWLRIAEHRKTMVFAVKVAHSKAIANEFNRRGINAEHLDAHHEDEERDEVLGRFRNGKTRVLCNVGLYTEGTDIPEIECIVLARPTKSLGFHLQMVGRGARPYPGKENFMVIDHGGNIERLGFYEDEVMWSLNGKGLAYKKKTERKKEKKLLSCDECRFVFCGPVCPQCGLPVKDYGKKIEAIDADLVELGKNRKKATAAEKQRFFGQLQYYRLSKGYAPGWAAHKYKEKFGVWPRGLNDEPIEIDFEFMNYIKHLQIKWAKSKRREEQNVPGLFGPETGSHREMAGNL